jgi:hypothetical protein
MPFERIAVKQYLPESLKVRAEARCFFFLNTALQAIYKKEKRRRNCV